ncbi:ExbD/TolR family protein [Nannocystaceae bacterium ST9]
MAGTTIVGGGGRRQPIVGINITPLVDVMLVLLVIMMVSATHIVSQTMKVNLPKTGTSDGGAASVSAVSITADHEIYFNRELVDAAALDQKLLTLAQTDPNATLVVSADAAADHGIVIGVLDQARAQGLVNFAVNVERKSK